MTMYPNQSKLRAEGKVTILWNQQVQTERTIPINKPDVIIRDSEKGTCMLIDAGISGERNMIIKEDDEKIIKYKYLTIEVRRMRHVKTEVISQEQDWQLQPSQHHSRQYLSNIWEKHEIKGLQKVAILGTAHTHTHTHTLQEVLV